MTIERQRLNIDLQELFPGGTLTIGEQVINIRPLGIRQLTSIIQKTKGLGSVLAEKGITWDTYEEPEKFLHLVALIFDNFPEALEEASNIALEDLQELPIEMIVVILNKVIEVNMQSKDVLTKNFNSLVKKLGLVTKKKRLTKKQ